MASPPDLITLENPLPTPTLLDGDSDDDHPGCTGLQAVASAFVPRLNAEPVSLLEGILIELKDGSSVVFRPSTGGKPAAELTTPKDHSSLRPAKSRGITPRRPRLFAPQPIKKVQAPLIELDLSSSSSIHIPPSYSPSPPPYLLAATPELTPPSSSSSRAVSPLLLPPTAFGDQPILFSTPQEVANLFKANVVPHPFPLAALAASDQRTQKEKGRSEEVLVDLEDSDEGMLDEVDKVVKRVTGNHHIPRPIYATTVQKSQDEGRIVDLGSSVIQPRPYRGVSHPMQFEAYRNGPETSTAHSYGLKSESPYALYSSIPSPRLRIPAHLLNPTPPDALQNSLMISWAGTEPTRETKEYLPRFLERLTTAINSRLGSRTTKGSRRFEVDLFGSVSWGGTTDQGGDVDLVLLDRQLPRGYEPSVWLVAPGDIRADVTASPRFRPFNTALPRPYHLQSLARTLTETGMAGVIPIVAATTPIVKFKDPMFDRDCDLNVNDLGGWYNSSLILHYCLIAPHLLRPLIHALKLWAGAHDLNDPSGAGGMATMSSYCITLMAIAYLQHLGCLPNLQADVRVDFPDIPTDADDPDVIWVGWGKDQGIKAHIGFSKSAPPGWTPRDPRLTVADAIRGFFRYFSRSLSDPEDRFDYSSSVLSVLHGGVIPRSHAVGEEARAEAKRRSKLVGDNLPLDYITRAMGEARQARYDDEVNMGKGDQGIQPRYWGERKIVVQDPFLWAKNCAGMMSAKGVDRFMGAVDTTHVILSGRGATTTLQDVLYNPSPAVRSAPKGGRGGLRGGAGRASSSNMRGRGSSVGKQLRPVDGPSLTKGMS